VWLSTVPSCRDLSQLSCGVRLGELWMTEYLVAHTSMLLRMCSRVMASSTEPRSRLMQVLGAPPRRMPLLLSR
jgi:hypothetical protein